MKRSSVVIGLIALLGITACTTQPFSQRLNTAVNLNAAIRTTASDSLKVDALKADEGQFVLNVTDNARNLLNAARVAQTGGDLETAEGRLALSKGVLNEIQKYLVDKQLKPKPVSTPNEEVVR